jgi:2'-5' RNA ligase
LRDAVASDAWRRGLVVTRRPAHPDVTIARPEQEQGHASAPPAHFDEAQAEQALWHEFRDHGASLNNTLNEALQIHGVTP